MLRRITCTMVAMAILTPSFAKAALTPPLLRSSRVAASDVDIRTPDGSPLLPVKAEASGKVRAFNTEFFLQLRPADVFTKDCIVEDSTVSPPREYPCPSRTYVGTVDGDPTARARLTVLDGGNEIVITKGDETFVVTPADRRKRRSRDVEYVSYRGSDINREALGELDCGSSDGDEHAEVIDEPLNASFEGKGAGIVYGNSVRRFPLLILQVMIDHGYLAAAGSDANAIAEIEGALADNKWVFPNRFNYFVQMGFLKLGTFGTPVTETTTVGADLLDELRDYRATLANPTNPSHCATQLFTTRALTGSGGGSAAGIARRQNLCNTNSVSVTTRRAQPHLSWVSGHELSHSAAACHIHNTDSGTCSTSACNSPSTDDSGTMMERTLGSIAKSYFDRSCSGGLVRNYFQTKVGAPFTPNMNGVFPRYCGDADGDGGFTIDTTDAQTALNMAVGSRLWNPLADVSPRDGGVTASDALYILDEAVGDGQIDDCATSSDAF